MTQHTHTPGPWHVGMAPGPIIYGADSSQVADLRGDLLPRPETIANMRLICAAPALLAALESLMARDLEHRLYGFPEVEQARAALASARWEG